MLYTTLLFFAFGVILLSFSFSLLDGILFTILVWFPAFAIQLGKEITDASQLIVNCWGIFFLGLLIARINKRRLIVPYQNIPTIDNNEEKNKTQNFYLYFLLFTLAATPFLIKLNFLPDYQSFQGATIFGDSKSPLFYVSTRFPYQILRLISIVVFINPIKFRNYNKKLIFLNGIFLYFFLQTFNLFIKYKSVLILYGIQLIRPLTKAFSIFFINEFSWNNVKKVFKNLLIKLKIKKNYFYILICAALFIVFITIFFSFYGFNLYELFVFKILTRGDLYNILDIEGIKKLTTEYSGNILYFIHPFLKILGAQGYENPMGTFIAAGYENSRNFIGGPNVHLPIVLYVIFGSSTISFLLIFLTGYLVGYILSICRFIILKSESVFSYKYIFSVIFFFEISTLIIEPSAWSHEIFFAFFASILINILKSFSYFRSFFNK